MSRVVDELPPAHQGFPRKYPWELWTNGKVHECVRGVDFDATPYGFTHAAYNHAERNGFRVTTRVRGNTVWLQFMNDDRPGAVPRKAG